jgi:hypothetical protein
MAVDTVNSLVTLAEAKAWIGIKTADTTYDALVENFIDGVSWQFNKYSGRLLKARDITEYTEGANTLTIKLKQWPVNSITSIFIDAEREYGATTEITDYTFHETGLVFSDTYSFSAVPNAVKIVYNAGYSTIPYDLKVAALDQIKWLFRRHRDNSEGVTSETTINGSTTRTEDGEMLTTSMEILKRYKKRDH